MKDAIRATDGLELLGDPLYVLAFRTTQDGVDVYRVMDEMTARGWSLNGLHRPACVHICVTLRHTQPELAERSPEGPLLGHGNRPFWRPVRRP